MLNLFPFQPVPGAIIESLADKPNQSIAELHSQTNKRLKREISIKNAYRIVADLLEQQVLVKINGKLSLNQVWISQLIRFSDSLLKQQQGESINILSLAEGETRTFYAESQLALDPTWNSLLLEIAQRGKSKQWYGFASHCWYSLSSLETEENYIKELGQNNVKALVLFGSNSFLDCYGASLVNRRCYHAVTTDKSPHVGDDYTYWVCGDLILEAFLPSLVAKRFAYFFNNVETLEEFDLQVFSDTFRMRARSSITVLRSKKEASKRKRLLVRHFNK